MPIFDFILHVCGDFRCRVSARALLVGLKLKGKKSERVREYGIRKIIALLRVNHDMQYNTHYKIINSTLNQCCMLLKSIRMQFCVRLQNVN